MRRVTWVIVAFAAVYIATFIAFQWQCYRLNAKCEEAMQKAKDADAMVKLIMLDQRMYRHQLAVSTLGVALEEMGMIDSAQYHRMWRCIDDTRISVLDGGMLQDALPIGVSEWRFDVEMPWHEIMENNEDFQY